MGPPINGIGTRGYLFRKIQGPAQITPSFLLQNLLLPNHKLIILSYNSITLKPFHTHAILGEVFKLKLSTVTPTLLPSPPH